MTTRTMKAAVWHGLNKPITIDTVPVPSPSGRQLLVRVKATSLCHSDLMLITGSLGESAAPQIVGHEAVSVVEELGPDAAAWGFRVGDLIGAPLWDAMCLECSSCTGAGPQFCPRMAMKGMTSPGCFSEYTIVDPACAVVIRRRGPQGADDDENPLPLKARELAPLFCAGATVWNALEDADLGIGETVTVVGVGGLGQLAAQYASRLGSKVVALDVSDDQLRTVKDGGFAHEVINTTGLPPAEIASAFRAVNGGELASAVLVTSGAVAGYQTAMAIAGTKCRVVAVGLPNAEVPLNMTAVAMGSIRLIGSRVPGKAGCQRCLDFTLRSQIKPLVNKRRFQLEDINEMVDLMKAGKVQDGRMVVEFF